LPTEIQKYALFAAGIGAGSKDISAGQALISYLSRQLPFARPASAIVQSSTPCLPVGLSLGIFSTRRFSRVVLQVIDQYQELIRSEIFLVLHSNGDSV